MRATLFTITCTTCQVRLAVRSESAVGAILECPKCGCMVPVIPPDGWQPPQSLQTPAVLSASDAMATAPGLESENGAAASVGGNSILVTAYQAAKNLFLRTQQSRNFLTAVPVAATAVVFVVWITMFSGTRSDQPATPVVEQPKAVSAPVAFRADDGQTDAKQKPLEQSTTVQQAETAATETKTPEVKQPEKKSPEVDKSDAKISADKNTLPAEVPAAIKTGQKKESAPTASGTSKLVKSIGPDKIDAQSRLGDVIPSIEFQGMPFARAIGLVAALSGLPITIDPDALARLGVSLRDPIKIRLKNATVEEVLQEIVAKRGMAFTAEDGQVVITSPEDQRETLRFVRYTVSDLTNNDKNSADQLAAMLQKLVSPASWQAGGGQGTVETEKAALVVTQTGDVHNQILAFCEKLRNARGRPLKSNRDPKRFDLSTRLQQAGLALNREVSANFRQPTSLVEILAYLGRQGEVDILLDRQALGTAGMSDKSEISFVVENRRLAAALSDLLAPLNLGYRPIDSHTIQVTTKSALDARLELEFYPLGKMLSNELRGSDMIEQIKNTISPAERNGAGRTSAIYFDQPSATLIVLQSPPLQAAIQVFLNKSAENQK